MNPYVNVNQLSRNMLKVAACVAFGALAVPAAYAAPEPAPVTAQNGTLTGTVVDANGDPVIGASVMIKGTKLGVATDLDGRFTIKAAPGSEVIVSSVGYQPKSFTVGNETNVSIVLEEDVEALGEVVVIGYGTQRKGDVTSAVAQVKAEDFIQGNSNNAGDLIKGKVAGLTIKKSSGDPGAGSEISLRGIVTLSGNAAPLVLIDGVPGDLSTVPPENISSVDVLKDASAAAIYGTRGAAGVILITTKSGQREQKTTATYSGYLSVSKWFKKMDFMDAGDIRAGLTNYNDEGYDTDWLKAISRTALTHNHSFSISGGNATTSYFGNFTYRNAEGVMKKTGNETLSMSFDVSHWMFNDILKVNLNLVADTYKYEMSPTTTIYRQAVIRNPTSPIWNEDGSYNEGTLLQYYNPVSLQNEYTGEGRQNNIRMTGNITVEPIKGWQTNLMLATHSTRETTKEYQTSLYTLNKLDGFEGTAGLKEWSNRTNYLELTSKYRANWDGIHRFEGLVGYSYSDETYEESSMWNANFPNDYFMWNNMSAGTYLSDGKAKMGSAKNSNKLIGWFARVSYGFDNRYNILASIRYEGSSKFGKNHKWGAFPSVSAGWNINNESFMESTRNWLSNLKLRVGYGITGVIPGDSYMSLVRYAYNGSYYYRDGKWNQALQAVSNPNPDLKWEKARELNFGLDWGVFNDRLTGNIDYYIKNTSDMLYDYAVPSPPNLYPSTYANVGKMRNSGIEIMIKAIPVTTKDFEWTTTLTMQHNKNKLVSLSNDLYQTDNTMWLMGISDPVSQYTHKVQVGEALGQIWSLKAVGVSEDTGLFLIENPKSGLTAEFYQEMRNDYDNWYQYMGNGIPKLSLGWSNQFNWRNWDLAMQFTGQFGFKIVNNQRVFYENNAHAYNKLKSVTDKIGGTRSLSAAQSQAVTSYYIEDGDYFKLTNIMLGYTVPLKKNNYVQNIRVYGSVDNVFTITKYKGIDPEINTENFWTAGVDDRDKYPTIRSFTFGASVTF